MAPQVKRAKTAFQFYQADHLALLRQEFSEMSQCMTELSVRWKALSPDGREPYLAKERVDRERYRKETAVADAEKAKQVEAKRLGLVAQEGEASSSRGARSKMNQRREIKEQRRLVREAEMDPEVMAERNRVREEKKREARERREERDAEERAVKERHDKLSKQEKGRASSRLEYLLQQSDIFAKFKGGGKAPTAESEKEKEKESRSKKKKKHNHRDEEVPSDEEVHEEEEEEHVFLTKQPNCIKFGTLKPYQLEGLNWMIHLAEKGLNGILADEMGQYNQVTSCLALNDED